MNEIETRGARRIGYRFADYRTTTSNAYLQGLRLYFGDDDTLERKPRMSADAAVDYLCGAADDQTATTLADARAIARQTFDDLGPAERREMVEEVLDFLRKLKHHIKHNEPAFRQGIREFLDDHDLVED